jgi:3-methyladenine DNA glycosylase AlkD
MSFIDDLDQALKKHRNPEYALLMGNYMKNNFLFLGIKTEERRTILNTVMGNYKDQIKTNFRQIVWELYNKTEREFHYCALDIIKKESKNKFVENDIELIQKLIVTNAWWDSVDVFAKYLLGGYLQQFPEKTFAVIETFSNDANMWLNRSAILFQLSYKSKTNFDLLKSECEKHKESKEFFIQKAIGWALRDYGKYNPMGVKEFVLSANLKPLSQREALRNIL